MSSKVGTFVVLGEPSDIEKAVTLSGHTVAELRAKWKRVMVQPAVSFRGYLIECAGLRAEDAVDLDSPNRRGLA